jgi:hypothetical protein
MTESFSVCQMQEDGTVLIHYDGLTEQVAEAEVDRINGNLALAGVPSTYYAFVV